MKVIWIGNIILPQIAEYEHIDKPVVGGWMVYLADLMSNTAGVSLVYLFDDSKERRGVANKIGYCSVYRKNNFGRELGRYYIDQIKKIFIKESPDVVHIWGTENEHAYAVVKAASELGIENRVVISIQGMLSVYAKDYYAFLPEKVINGISFKDILYGNIKKQRDEFIKKGIYEKKAIKNVMHIIGRTDWDKANVWAINPGAEYHHNNEILRREFYSGQWSYESCEKHTIFCSQSHYPIKGIHLMLKALKTVKEHYPDVILYIGGKDYSVVPKIKLSSYQRYVLTLIDKYKLSSNVIFTGFLDAEHMKERYLKSNVFISPSSIENSPNSVGEAMLLGTPVVSSRVGGVHNMLTHGKEGFLYPTNEVGMLAYYICKIFDMKGNVLVISRAAKTRAMQTHNVDVNLEKLLIIYNQIIETM